MRSAIFAKPFKRFIFRAYFVFPASKYGISGRKFLVFEQHNKGVCFYLVFTLLMVPNVMRYVLFVVTFFDCWRHSIFLPKPNKGGKQWTTHGGRIGGTGEISLLSCLRSLSNPDKIIKIKIVSLHVLLSSSFLENLASSISKSHFPWRSSKYTDRHNPSYFYQQGPHANLRRV